jgi:transposase
MIRYVGIDLHKRLIEICIVDDSGKVVGRRRLTEVTEASVTTFARRYLQPGDHVALEATTNVWAVAGLLERIVARVVVSNPVLNKAIAHAKVKTDKVDAEVLAHLLRLGYLPEVWQPDAATRRTREWTTRRSGLVSQRTGLVNRVHSTLAQRLLACPHEVTSPVGRKWLAALPADDDLRWLLDSDLRALDALQAEIAAIDVQLAQRGYADERVRLLMTLPGVSQHTAQALLAAIGDVSRFADADSLAAYLGLTPRTRQSATHCYHGPITKAGRSHTRWMLVQAAHTVQNHPGPLGYFFRRLKARKTHNVAVVATARKLAILAWHVLTSGEPYRYAVPSTTEAKLAKLRVTATGEKRRTGPRKGEKSQAKLPGGSRTIKPLEAVYELEGVPAVKAPPAGEARHVEEIGLTSFAASLHEEHVVPRRGGRTQALPVTTAPTSAAPQGETHDAERSLSPADEPASYSKTASTSGASKGDTHQAQASQSTVYESTSAGNGPSRRGAHKGDTPTVQASPADSNESVSAGKPTTPRRGPDSIAGAAQRPTRSKGRRRASVGST